jgi:hypothetical protein
MANTLEQQLKAEIQERRTNAEAAWSKWRESDFDVLDAIKNA